MADTGEVDRMSMFPFHAKTKEECYAELGCPTDLDKSGLSSEDAAKRLEKYGPNKLMEKEKVTIWRRIWNQVNNVLVAILVFVAVVSMAQAIRYGLENDSQNTTTNSIQVGLIFFVIT
jgi:magnesium-transporting ATPase (P-type)